MVQCVEYYLDSFPMFQPRTA